MDPLGLWIEHRRQAGHGAPSPPRLYANPDVFRRQICQHYAKRIAQPLVNACAEQGLAVQPVVQANHLAHHCALIVSIWAGHAFEGFSLLAYSARLRSWTAIDPDILAHATWHMSMDGLAASFYGHGFVCRPCQRDFCDHPRQGEALHDHVASRQHHDEIRHRFHAAMEHATA